MDLGYTESRRVTIDILRNYGYRVNTSAGAIKLASLIAKVDPRAAMVAVGKDRSTKGISRKVIRRFASTHVAEHRAIVFKAKKGSGRCFEQSSAFTKSREWKAVRYQALKLHGAKCQCCGASPQDGASLNVDHIYPRSTHPELALDINNLQVLCADCNAGKSNVDTTDFRRA